MQNRDIPHISAHAELQLWFADTQLPPQLHAALRSSSFFVQSRKSHIMLHLVQHAFRPSGSGQKPLV